MIDKKGFKIDFENLHFTWNDRFQKFKKDKFEEILKRAKLVVIGEQILHVVTERFKGHNINPPLDKVVEAGFRYFQSEILPLVKAKPDDTKVVMMSAEGRWKFTDYSDVFINKTDEDWKVLVDQYNDQIEKMVSEAALKNFVFVKSNTLTMRSPEGDVLSVDNIHKMHWLPDDYEGPGRRIPDSLKADTDVLLNYFCNEKVNLYNRTNLCCS